MDNRMRKEQLECKTKVMLLIQWLSALPYYTRLNFIDDALIMAKLNDKYLYIILKWLLRVQWNKPTLLDMVYNLIETKKNYDIKNIFIEHDFWFSKSCYGVNIPGYVLNNFANANTENKTQTVDIPRIENLIAISDMEY